MSEKLSVYCSQNCLVLLGSSFSRSRLAAGAEHVFGPANHDSPTASPECSDSSVEIAPRINIDHPENPYPSTIVDVYGRVRGTS